MNTRRLLKLVYHAFFRLKKRVRNFFAPTGFIILYHRVASVKNDPHQLCVSPENFRQQIKFLKENFCLISLAELVQDLKAQKVKNKSVVITFDDGYADNLHYALPILAELDAPATIFLTSGYLNQNKPFYWDENAPLEDRGRPLTLEEARTLSHSHLIEIGGHSVNHPNLAGLTPEEQLAEIAEGKDIIEKMLNIFLSGFVYPFGKHNKASIAAVQKAGFQYACSTSNERVTSRSNIYALPRYAARNWSLNEFQQKLKGFI